MQAEEKDCYLYNMMVMEETCEVDYFRDKINQTFISKANIL